MNGKMRKVERYEVTIYGVTFSNLRLDSEWEGMMKLIHRDGFMIVAQTTKAPDIFDRLTNTTPTPRVELISASPAILDRFKALEETQCTFCGMNESKPCQQSPAGCVNEGPHNEIQA